MKNRQLFLRALLILSTFFILPVTANSNTDKVVANNDCFSTDWPHEKSDLNPDPSIIFGEMENGFRTVMMVNREPKNRVALYLNVQAGSLHETDEQRGVAHFLEHMLFNGSTHFPTGTLIEYFQSIGMNFGGDTNAHTTYDETVYNIILPGNSKEEIDKGLLVMSDYSRGALIPESEVNRERGVILSEKRARDSADYRTHVATTAFTMRGTRVVDRMPIGTVETLEKADRKLLLDYYNKWYRPENMALIIVGDFDPELVQPLVEKRFAKLQSGAPIPQCPSLGQTDHKGTEFFYHYEPEQGYTEISIESIWNEKPQDDSFALQIENLERYAVSLLMRHRFEKMVENGQAPFTSGGYSAGSFLDSIGYSSIHVKTNPDKWQQSLNILEQTLRGSLNYGFSKEELHRVKKELTALFESAVMTANTRSSTHLAGQIIYHLNKNRVLQSPLQEKELFSPVIDNLTPEIVHERLKKSWSQQNRLVSLTGNSEVKGNKPKDVISNQYEQSLKEQVVKLTETAKFDFPYLNLYVDMVKPPKIKDLKEIDSQKIIFNNGVIVNLKQTSFKKNSISIVADLDAGRQSEPSSGMGMLAEAVINHSGTGKLKESELKSALAGTTVDLSFKVGQTSFRWQGGSLSSDIEQLFQLLQSQLVDPGMREDAYRLAMQNFKQMYQKLGRDINGAMQLRVNRFFGGGNDFFGLAPWVDFSRISLKQIRDWLMPILYRGSVEISIVGDFEKEKIIELSSNYFGSLPQRKQNDIPEEMAVFPAGQTLQTEVETTIDKALIVIGWPTEDFWDISRTRRLHILASVFRDRLRKVIREKLGATYSPTVYNHSSRVFPGYGVMKVMMISHPQKVDILKNEVLKLADELRKQGVSEEELLRAKAPSLTSIKDMLRTNEYWLNSVLSLSSRYPMQLQWPTTILSDFGAITKEELSEMAQTYFDNKKSGSALVIPITE